MYKNIKIKRDDGVKEFVFVCLGTRSEGEVYFLVVVLKGGTR